MVLLQPNTDVAAMATAGRPRVGSTQWSLALKTPMMVSTEVLESCTSDQDALLARIGARLDVADTMEAHVTKTGYRVNLHADSADEATRMKVDLARLLLEGQSMAACVPANDRGICIVPERTTRTVELTATDQDSCVTDENSECHVQMMQMFAKQMLPMVTYAASVAPAVGAATRNGLAPVDILLHIHSLTQHQSTAALDYILASNDDVGELSGHRRELQQAAAGSLTCDMATSSALVTRVCCAGGDCAADGFPTACDYTCALTSVLHLHSCPLPCAVSTAWSAAHSSAPPSSASNPLAQR